MLEAELQSNVRAAALVNGWLFYHTHRSDRSDEGFYDCVMKRLRGDFLEVLYVELKREGKNPTDAQQKWQDVSNIVNGLPLRAERYTVFMDTLIWRPMDWLDGAIQRRLSR